MSSAPPNSQSNDYVAFVLLTTVGYDYILTFSNELEYIWAMDSRINNVRYVGLYSLIASSLGQIIVITNYWAFCLFFGAADFVMLLRVWAMYDRSRLILCALIPLYILEIISIVVPTAFYTISTTIPVTGSQTLICIQEFSNNPSLTPVGIASQALNGIAMCVFVIVRFVRQSLQLYRTTKRLQFNRYMTLLVRQGILYFFVWKQTNQFQTGLMINFRPSTFLRLGNIIHGLAASGKLPLGGWRLMLLCVVQFVPLFTLLPRFIMSIRELYARDVQGRRGEGIDTGFGLTSSDQEASETALVFVGVEEAEGLEDVEETDMDSMTTRVE
ncbi:hypothetical protein L210DRAFT_1054374 [Boletus edulis BED1]|uniref:DUF6533 domain-containing protein n=1 Tax=Boletus edulis BED1 TaxID=1328754 RepID=A0AAD4BWU2_BOLED|nr:hypothetical protein L210DRAFT_1054374 [Boletus edulis BED1]